MISNATRTISTDSYISTTLLGQLQLRAKKTKSMYTWSYNDDKIFSCMYLHQMNRIPIVELASVTISFSSELIKYSGASTEHAIHSNSVVLDVPAVNPGFMRKPTVHDRWDKLVNMFLFPQQVQTGRRSVMTFHFALQNCSNTEQHRSLRAAPKNKRSFRSIFPSMTIF